MRRGIGKVNAQQVNKAIPLNGGRATYTRVFKQAIFQQKNCKKKHSIAKRLKLYNIHANVKFQKFGVFCLGQRLDFALYRFNLPLNIENLIASMVEGLFWQTEGKPCFTAYIFAHRGRTIGYRQNLRFCL